MTPAEFKKLAERRARMIKDFRETRRGKLWCRVEPGEIKDASTLATGDTQHRVPPWTKASAELG